MKKTLYTIAVLLLLSGGTVHAQYVLQGNQGGTGLSGSSGGSVGDCLKILTLNPRSWNTGTCGSGGGGFWPFVTTNTNFNVAVQSTSTPEWFTSGMHASSTSHFANLTVYDNFKVGVSSALTVTGVAGGDVTFTGANAIVANGQGTNFSMNAGSGNGTGAGGSWELFAGIGGGDGGGSISLNAGDDTTSGGNVVFVTGAGATPGTFRFNPSNLGAEGILNFDSLAADRIYTFPDQAGTICLVGVACDGAGGSGVWPFTTTDTNYAVAVQSTTTPEWFKNGVFASSTSRFVYASTTAISSTAGAYFATAGGRVGVGTTTPGGTLHIVSEFAPVQIVERNTTQTTGLRRTGIVRVTSTGSAADGFGPGWGFSINDLETNGDNDIATIAAFRDGADNSGALTFYTYNAGSQTEKVRITSGGNTGIGSTTPWGLLSVNPNALGSGVPEFVVGSSTATHFIVNGAGQVGIGTYAPTGQLSLAIGSSAVATKSWTTQSRAILDSYASTDALFPRYLDISVIGAADGTNGGGAIRFITNPVSSNTGVERMRINTDGNVGIASTTPGTLFSINGVANFQTGTSTYQTGINLMNGGCFAISGTCVSGSGGSGTVSSGLAGQLGYYNASGSTIVGTSTNPLYVNNVTASSTSATSTFAGGFTANNGRLVSDWNTGSTTISNLYAGLPQFDLNAGVVTALDNPISAAASAGTIESYTFNIMGSSSLTMYGKADGAGFVQSGAWGVGVGTTSPWTRFAVSGTGAWNGLTAAGATQNSLCINGTTKEIMENAASSCLVSSLRFKKEVRGLLPDEAMYIIRSLRPVDFRYKESNIEAIGLIAEEAYAVDPRLATKNSKGQVNSINYEQITASLVKVVQGQEKRIKALEDEIKKLK